MRLKLACGPTRSRTAAGSPGLRQRVRSRLRRATRGWRVRALARVGWCAHCEVRPRARLEGRISRFCSVECANAEADANWSIW
jgi:hypothetical protein